MSGWQGTALAYIPSFVLSIFVMVIMEQVNLFKLAKYINVVLKTTESTPSKHYLHAFPFTMCKSHNALYVYDFSM